MDTETIPKLDTVQIEMMIKDCDFLIGHEYNNNTDCAVGMLIFVLVGNHIVIFTTKLLVYPYSGEKGNRKRSYSNFCVVDTLGMFHGEMNMSVRDRFVRPHYRFGSC